MTQVQKVHSGATPIQLFQAPAPSVMAVPAPPQSTRTSIPLDEPFNAFLKRCLDIVGALVGIICGLPLFLLTAIAIKRDSPGPVLFSTKDDGTPMERVGKDGKPFRHYKFRSMLVGTHARRDQDLAGKNERADGPLFKMKDDPRVTRVGAFLRRWSIDESAEFFLVLKGDMSLVGPRPHLPEEVAKYGADWHRESLRVKPGITGPAQISGRANLGPEDEALRNYAYLYTWTIWQDIAILFKTIPAVLFGRGAY